MATNIISDGSRLTIIAPSGGVSSGALLVTGNSFGIALANAASGANVVVQIGCEATLRKSNAISTSIVQGGVVYWDAANSNCTPSATANRLIGVASTAVGNTDTAVIVSLNPSFA